MIRNYFKIAFRNLSKNKGYSAINIGGLALGMAVAMLIGLWVFDELSFDKNHKNYNRVAQLYQFVTFEVEKQTYNSMPLPLAEELRTHYPDFEKICVGRETSSVLSVGDKKLEKTGQYAEPTFFDIMTPELLAGTVRGFDDQNSIILSQSLAQSLFGNANPLDQLIKIDNKLNVKVSGVFADFPRNSTFNQISYILPWKLRVATDAGTQRALQEWDENNFQIWGLLKEHADFASVSAKIKDIRMKKDNPPGYKPEFFLLPMHDWHLRNDFKNGVQEGGLITFVWLFGIIGIFVLLLACINFMNLSTARSEKRAREVGIRKAVGSLRAQLVGQFFSESLFVVFLSFLLALALAALSMPFFNSVAEKNMQMPWTNPIFWLSALVFCLFVGIIAGSYPAIYLSSFQPVKVLKGGGSSIRIAVGKFAALPRKVLVVLQFTVSVTLIIGTIVIFRQIQFAKNRPVGYHREGLIEVSMNTPELYGHYQSLRNDLLNTGAVKEMSESSGSVTVQYGGTTDMSWPGKKPDEHPLMMSNFISHDYGKTIGWELAAGRDFSREFATDTSAIILNESAVKIMRIEKPLETIVRRSGRDYRVVGVVKDMIKENPFSPVNPSFFVLGYTNVNVINIRLAPQKSAQQSLAQVGQVFAKYNPANPFVYKFVDQEYNNKFGEETRIGKLATGFAMLAIFISFLGLFGLASFVAEQRTKEIGIRKVLGASIINLWQMLSQDFLVLVLISCLIATPVAWYFMDQWLADYTYRTEISWWIFAATAAGALGVTLATVSFQAIRAALLNPVKTLKSE